jgi:hypothetical protein
LAADAAPHVRVPGACFHDEALARHAERIVALRDGRVVAQT